MQRVPEVFEVQKVRLDRRGVPEAILGAGQDLVGIRDLVVAKIAVLGSGFFLSNRSGA